MAQQEPEQEVNPPTPSQAEGARGDDEAAGDVQPTPSQAEGSEEDVEQALQEKKDGGTT